ncbi:MAG: anhydro-N-acetylmuramic acid kinase [Spirochaetia bacterium]|jgi:anhydro-N-acetylmuramic acid kinase
MDSARDEVGFRKTYASKTEHHIIGLMSGTSLDGVDATLVRIVTEQGGAVTSIGLIAHSSLEYSTKVRSIVAALCSPETARIDDLTYAHYGLSEWYARAVSLVMEKSGLPLSEIDAISMHGQTVWHAPLARAFPGPEGDIPVKGTLQLGSAAVLRERTGLPVIADLRARDMAAGGEGAPLATYIDAILFGSKTEGRIVQNIGGIGNATVVPAAAKMQDILAFDTGPGNMVIDAVVSLGTGGAERYDPEGSLAARGKVCKPIVENLMKDPFFKRKPPKSTGREVYGVAFAAAFVKDAVSQGLSFEDQVATATAFTAESIAAAYRDFILPRTSIAAVLVAGGGALNTTLLRMIRERLPAGISVTTSAAFGVPDQAREAMAFAVLGHESLMGRPGNLPAVTGARTPVVLGSITL